MEQICDSTYYKEIKKKNGGRYLASFYRNIFSFWLYIIVNGGRVSGA